MTHNKKNRKSTYSLFRIWDVIVIVVVLLLVALALYFTLSPEKGSRAEVYVSGEKKAELVLSKDAELELNGLKLIVSGGKIWVHSSDCPDKICETTGKIYKKGQTIVCLPNQVIVRIVGKGEVEAIS